MGCYIVRTEARDGQLPFSIHDAGEIGSWEKLGHSRYKGVGRAAERGLEELSEQESELGLEVNY